ncbi:MAG: SAM-dependent methyltransferase [bacterium]|nr:SAM-dependent methyltransferase [bacterium]
MKLLKKLVGKIIPAYIKGQLRNFHILAFEYGQFITIKNWECVDKYGNPIPWYTYPAIEYLSSLEFSKKNIFEFGGGNSTIWWAKRAKFVVTVEKDKDWYQKITEKVREYNNVKLILSEDEESYVSSIKNQGMVFDVVVIDGHWRGKCAKILDESVLNTIDGYMIILDNSDWYPNVANFICKRFDLIRVDFHGFGAINNYTWTTTLFFPRNYKICINNDLCLSNATVQQLAEDDILI